MRLFFFPYAGGSANSFINWKRELEESFIEVEIIELSGRGKRISEPLYKNMSDVVDDLYECIVTDYQINHEPYAFFGHSMGSLISYELYYKLLDYNMPLPVHLFISGIKPPHLERRKLHVDILNDSELIKEIEEFDGTPRELLENKGFIEYYLPIIRSDFSIVDNYGYTQKKNKIHCSISILNGIDDHFHTYEIDEWRYYSEQQTYIKFFDGGHFYLNQHIKEIINYMNSVLGYYVKV